MFKELLPVLRDRAVLLTVTLVDTDQIRVNIVTKKLKDGDNDALTTPSLSALQTLDISGTNVHDLTPLATLSALQTLEVANTLVSDLTPLSTLSALRTLDISGTKVNALAPLVEFIRKGLPVKWGSSTGQIPGIYVEDCPLSNPPREIVVQGDKAILNYFVERATGQVDHLYEAKMLVLGEGGAGKTSLIRRLYEPDKLLPAEKDTTHGIEIYKHAFKLKNGHTFRLNVWDFGGQQIYHATHQFFLTHRSLYVLLDDTRKDHKSVSDQGFRYWLELIEVFGGHSPTLIFQNEKDGRSKAIDLTGIKRRYDNVTELYAGNLEHAHAADKLRDGIEFYATNLSHIGDELPAGWIKIRADVERLAADRPYVPVEEYFHVYGLQLEFDDAKALYLSRYLHDLGVFLHYQDDPLLKRTVILQNEWATAAVFRVLDDEVVKKNLGRFDLDDCARLWKGTEYERMHLELLALMRKFELCYELRDTDVPTWLAPQLLPPAKPNELSLWPQTGDLILRYRYEFLPKGMISRLTVRLHRFVFDPEKAWISGVLFDRGDTAVLVEILPTGDEIELRARGPEHKALLSVVAADLDALNESFEGLRDKVHKSIPCNCEDCRAAMSPAFFAYKELLRRKEHKRRTIECPNSYEKVEVLELLDGIKSEGLPAWAKGQPSVIHIFLASSSELRADRDTFDLYLRQQNDMFMQEGIYLEIVRWENFLDAMSETRLQDEYNNSIRDCDVFISLFFTKAGKFTEEEFDVAHRQFEKTGKPLIYTFFLSADVNIDKLPKSDFDSLRAFQARLDRLGHFFTRYNNIEDLKLKFRDQLPKIRKRLGL
jgi:internalin A